MNAKENLFYSLGHLVYAVAMADGVVQADERRKLHQLIKEENASSNWGYDIAEIAFQISERDKRDLQTAYDWAIKSLYLGEDYLTEELKVHFLSILEKVAEAYPPKTSEEQRIINNYKTELLKLKK